MKHSKFRQIVRKTAREEGVEGLVLLVNNLPKGIKPRHLVRALLDQGFDFDFIQQYEEQKKGLNLPLVRPSLTKGPEYYKRRKVQEDEEQPS
jgi:hypothetical protein